MSKTSYQAVQQDAFGDLVRKGVFNEKFQHADWARTFFTETLQSLLQELPRDRSARVLDAGCGSGVWLEEVRGVGLTTGRADMQLYGFDITPEMVDIAARRLDGSVPRDNFRTGDILEEESYCFAGVRGQFDLIYVYDVIQQLPRKLQFDACKVVVRQLSPNGVAVFFDQDSRSRYGRIMGVKKFLRQYLGVPMVPRYYCNAKYPPIRLFAKNLASLFEVETVVREAPGAPKRALIVRNGASR